VGWSNNGKDYVAEATGGRNFGRAQAAAAAVTYAATSLTDTGGGFTASTGTPGTPGTGTGLVGAVIVVGGAAANSAPVAYGVVRDNTTTVLSIDFWHTINAPQTVATTPTGTGTGSGYAIVPARPPAFFMGLSVATRVFNAADPFLSNDGTTISEIFGAAQAGLSRQIAAYAHTSGTNTWTIGNTFTAGGSDTLPAAVAKVGTFVHGATAAPTTTTTGIMMFNSNLTSTATLNATGDNTAITDTITAT
jgi:hypothetical protein